MADISKWAGPVDHLRTPSFIPCFVEVRVAQFLLCILVGFLLLRGRGCSIYMVCVYLLYLLNVLYIKSHFKNFQIKLTC